MPGPLSGQLLVSAIWSLVGVVVGGRNQMVVCIGEGLNGVTISIQASKIGSEHTQKCRHFRVKSAFFSGEGARPLPILLPHMRRGYHLPDSTPSAPTAPRLVRHHGWPQPCLSLSIPAAAPALSQVA